MPWSGKARSEVDAADVDQRAARLPKMPHRRQRAVDVPQKLVSNSWRMSASPTFVDQAPDADAGIVDPGVDACRSAPRAWAAIRSSVAVADVRFDEHRLAAGLLDLVHRLASASRVRAASTTLAPRARPAWRWRGRCRSRRR
jgi:hypothetical protein